MKLKQFIGIAILLGGMVCAALPASAQMATEGKKFLIPYEQLYVSTDEGGMWMKNAENFPKDIPILKVRLKDNGGTTSDFFDFATIYLNDAPNAKWPSHEIDARKFKVNRTKFKKLEVGEDGWRIYTFEKPAYMRSTNTNSASLLNVQFLIDDNALRDNLVKSVGNSASIKDMARIAAFYKDGNPSSLGIKSELKFRPSSDKAQDYLAKVEKKRELERAKKYRHENMIVTKYSKEIDRVNFNSAAPDIPGTLVGTTYDNKNKCHMDKYLDGTVRYRFSNGDYFVAYGSRGWNENVKLGARRTHELFVGVYQNGVFALRLKNGVEVFRDNDCNDLYAIPILNDTEKNEDGTFKFKSKKYTTSLKGAFGCLYRPGESELLRYVTFKPSEGPFYSSNDWYSEDSKNLVFSGFLSGNRLYELSPSGALVHAAYVFHNVPYPATANDEIVSAEAKNDGDQELTLKYANGDCITFTGNYLNEWGEKSYSNYGGNLFAYNGEIHRNGGILKFENGKTLLELPNGDKYVGTFYKEDDDYYTGMSIRLKDFSIETLRYQDGTLYKKDGKTVKYIKGRSELEIAAEKAANDAKDRKEYQQLCAKYGKQYVDAANNGEVIVGMPEELFKRRFWWWTVNSESAETRWYASYSGRIYIRVNKSTGRVDYVSRY